MTIYEAISNPELNEKYEKLETLQDELRSMNSNSKNYNNKLMDDINSLFHHAYTINKKQIIDIKSIFENKEEYHKLFKDRNQMYLSLSSTGIGIQYWTAEQIRLFKKFKNSESAEEGFKDVILNEKILKEVVKKIKPLNKKILFEIKEISDKYKNLEEIEFSSIKIPLQNPESFFKELFGGEREYDANRKVYLSIDEFSGKILLTPKNEDFSYSVISINPSDTSFKTKIFDLMAVENHVEEIEKAYKNTIENMSKKSIEWENMAKEMNDILAPYLVFKKI